MKACAICRDEYDDADVTPEGACLSCARKTAFASFAASCGLSRFPDPSGERYVYRTDGKFAGKKGECVDLMDDLWDALCRAKGRHDLILGKE